MREKLTRLPLRLVLSGVHRLRQLRWYFSRPRSRGAHAVAVTAEGRIVLVRLRYAPGWRLPGGGIEPGETPEEAALRELREEIGLISHGSVRLAWEGERVIQFRRDLSTVFLVTGVTYAPRWSWEVEAAMECAPGALPPRLSPRAREWIEAALPLLRG